MKEPGGHHGSRRSRRTTHSYIGFPNLLHFLHGLTCTALAPLICSIPNLSTKAICCRMVHSTSAIAPKPFMMSGTLRLFGPFPNFVHAVKPPTTSSAAKSDGLAMLTQNLTAAAVASCFQTKRDSGAHAPVVSSCCAFSWAPNVILGRLGVFRAIFGQKARKTPRRPVMGGSGFRATQLCLDQPAFSPTRTARTELH